MLINNMEKGIVKEILDDNILLVDLSSLGDCNSCPGKKSCNMFSKGDKTIKARYEGSIKKGDLIQIVFKPKNRVISSLLVFFLPIVALIGGYYLGINLFNSEGYGIIFSIGGLVLTFLAIYVFLKLNKKSINFLPIAIKVNK